MYRPVNLVLTSPGRVASKGPRSVASGGERSPQTERMSDLITEARPLSNENSVDGDPELVPKVKQPKRPSVVLLVEDDDDLATLFRINFRKFFSYAQLACAPNGVSAVKYILDNGIPDLIITDLSMPEMNSYELLDWIRTDPSIEKVPVVVHSSCQNPADLHRCHTLGATEFLPKGASVIDLNALLHRYLEVLPDSSE